jgi:hypothetical protein
MTLGALDFIHRTLPDSTVFEMAMGQGKGNETPAVPAKSVAR